MNVAKNIYSYDFFIYKKNSHWRLIAKVLHLARTRSDYCNFLISLGCNMKGCNDRAFRFKSKCIIRLQKNLSIKLGFVILTIPNRPPKYSLLRSMSEIIRLLVNF